MDRMKKKFEKELMSYVMAKKTDPYQESTKLCRSELKKKNPKPRPTIDTKEAAISKADILTPAGVMKFLLQRSGKTPGSTELLGPLGISMFEEQRIYTSKEKEFHDKFNRAEIHHKNALMRHTTNILGDDSIESNPELLEQLINERDQALLEYQKALGACDNNAEDMSRRKVKVIRQRIVRDAFLGEDNVIRQTLSEDNLLRESSTFIFGDTDDTDTAIQWIRKIALHRFIQGALIIITRYRVDKRLVKIRALVKKIKKEKESESTFT